MDAKEYLTYLRQVASQVEARGYDLYEAINAAECLTLKGNNVKEDAMRVVAVLEGEL